MVRPFRTTLLLIVVALAAANVSAQKIPASKSAMPLTDDGECKNASKVPPRALAALLRTKLVREMLPDSRVNDPSELFQGTSLRLGRGDQTALLICGMGAMTGADNNWYWIVDAPYTHPHVVLFEGSGRLTIVNRFHHGYKDIESGWAVAAQSAEKTFHFDGTKYVLVLKRCYVPDELTMKRVKCY